MSKQAWHLENKYYFFYNLEKLKNDLFINKNECVLVTCKSLLNSKYLINIKNLFSIKECHCVPSNPSLDFLEKKITHFNNKLIIGVGGGSVIDYCKILLWISTYNYIGSIHKLFLEDFVSNIEKNNQFQGSSKLLIFPSTTGTGSEVTPFATIWDRNKSNKLSFKSNKLNFLVFYDHNLVKLQPRKLLLSSLFDSLSHSFESLWNIKKNFYSEILATESIKIILPILQKIKDNKKLNNQDYKNLCLSTFMSGSAISITETAICHSMSYPITLKYNLNHGLAVGYLLPACIMFNSEFVEKELKAIINSLNMTCIDNFIYLIAELFQSTGAIAYVKKKIISSDELYKISADMINPSRTKNNIKKISPNSIKEIINNLKKIYTNV